MVPYLREARIVLKHGWRATRDSCYGVTGRTYAARNLERLFEHTTDPWDFANSERAKARFEAIWQLVPKRAYQRILEIGCAEGHFTEQIARHFAAEIWAVDFIPLALQRAAQRCAPFRHVRFQSVDISKSGPEGQFDLIFCMGVLEDGPKSGYLDRIRDRIVAALRPGGYLVLESGRLPPEFERRWWARKLGCGARALHDRFLVPKEMTLLSEMLVYGDQRLASLLQKEPT
jgi:SAM-dependent methyltransferase